MLNRDQKNSQSPRYQNTLETNKSSDKSAGSLQFPLLNEHSQKQNLSQSLQAKRPQIENYEFIKPIGTGAFGDVVLARNIHTKEQHAIKVIDKRFLEKEKKQYQVFIEREMLVFLNHPGILKLDSTFKSKENIYFVLEYLSGGDFATYIKTNLQTLQYLTIQFYVAQIVVILEYLHGKGIAHRDVKPENMLISASGHLKMIDFATATVYNDSLVPRKFAENIRSIKARFSSDPEDVAKQLTESKTNRGATFVGSSEYISPELLDTDICEGPADLWALGCIIYKLYTGTTPFFDVSEYLIWKKIQEGKYVLPDDLPEPVYDLIDALLQKNPANRLGSGTKGSLNDFSALKKHQFFEGVNFERLWLDPPPTIHNRNLTGSMIDPEMSDMNRSTQLPKQSNVKVVFHGLVNLHTLWCFYKPVELVLFHGNRYLTLLFLDPETAEAKVQCLVQENKIHLTEDVMLKLNKREIKISNHQTQLCRFSEIEHAASHWYEVIQRSRQKSS